MTLPNSSACGRTIASSTSLTLLVFSIATPLATCDVSSSSMMYRTIDDREGRGAASAAFRVEHLDRRVGAVERSLDLGAA